MAESAESDLDGGRRPGGPAAVTAALATEPGPALDRLVELYLPDVYAYAFRLTGSGPDADDLAQQVFLVARQRWSQLRDWNRARAWLLAITRNCFLKDVRRRQPVNETDGGVELSGVVGPGWEVESIDRERLAIALESLSEPFRIALMMYYFEDLGYQEMADELGVPVGTVMSRLARAKQHLRRAWEASLGAWGGTV